MSEQHFVLRIQYVGKPIETRSFAAAKVSIGRDVGDIVLGDPQSSARHAEIEFSNEHVLVRDLGSTNGTIFNGLRSPEFVVQPGQFFQCGQTVITLLSVPQPVVGGGRTIVALGHVPVGRPAPPVWTPPAGTPARPVFQPLGAATPAASHPASGAPASTDAIAGPSIGMEPTMAMPAVHSPGAVDAAAFGPPGMSTGVQPGGAPASAWQTPRAFLDQQPLPVGPPPAVPVAPPPSGSTDPRASGVPSIQPNFVGTGAELFGVLFVGGLLCLLTLGLYVPWFVCSLQKFVASRTTLGPTRRGMLRLEFIGNGGELFVMGIVGGLLTMSTLGLYFPWFACRLIRFFTDNTTALADDGTRYKLRFGASGGDLLVSWLVGGLLCFVTLGIYAPWFVCSLLQLLASRTVIEENGTVVGQLEFVGQGAELFGTYIVGMLLTAITFGIYGSWFQVSLFVFFAKGTRVHVQGETLFGEFTGTGGEYFVITLVGTILTLLTLGIYVFWYIASTLRFQYNHLAFYRALPGASRVAIS